MRAVANKIWFIEDHQLKEYPGPYDEYAIWKEQRDKDAKNNPKPVEAVKKKEEKVIPAVKKTNSPDLKNKQINLEKTEQKITALEKQLKQIEEDLAKPSVYGNVELLSKTNKAYEKTKEELNKEQADWEKQAEEIDLLEKKLV